MKTTTGVPATRKQKRIGGNITRSEERDIAAIPRRATAILEDADLLREVLRRACLICPDEVRAALWDAEDRMRLARDGGYIERYGKAK